MITNIASGKYDTTESLRVCLEACIVFLPSSYMCLVWHRLSKYRLKTMLCTWLSEKGPPLYIIKQSSPIKTERPLQTHTTTAHNTRPRYNTKGQAPHPTENKAKPLGATIEREPDNNEAITTVPPRRVRPWIAATARSRRSGFHWEQDDRSGNAVTEPSGRIRCQRPPPPSAS